jgi:hypothetical protein
MTTYPQCFHVTAYLVTVDRCYRWGGRYRSTVRDNGLRGKFSGFPGRRGNDWGLT